MKNFPFYVKYHASSLIINEKLLLCSKLLGDLYKKSPILMEDMLTTFEQIAKHLCVLQSSGSDATIKICDISYPVSYKILDSILDRFENDHDKGVLLNDHLKPFYKIVSLFSRILFLQKEIYVRAQCGIISSYFLKVKEFELYIKPIIINIVEGWLPNIIYTTLGEQIPVYDIIDKSCLDPFLKKD